MSKIKPAQWIIAALALLAVVWFVAAPGKPHPVELGEKAPSFSLPRLEGDPIALRNFRGKVVILNFWATWCPPCVDETPGLEALAHRMQGHGVIVLGVSVDEDSQALEKFVSTFHLTYPIARDPRRALATRYGTFKFPESYIIDRSGRVAEKIIGETDWTDPHMIAFVEDLAGGGPSSGR